MGTLRESSNDHVDSCSKECPRLRSPLLSDNGVMLLAAGSPVTPRLAQLLDHRGIRARVEVTIEVVNGSPDGLEIPLREGKSTIGRRPDCRVRPASALVSGYHCRIYRNTDRLAIRDLSSTNGTFVNGRPISNRAMTAIRDSDRIRLGNLLFRVHRFATIHPDRGRRSLPESLGKEFAAARVAPKATIEVALAASNMDGATAREF